MAGDPSRGMPNAREHVDALSRELIATGGCQWDTLKAILNALTPEQRQRVRDKARWEGVPLLGPLRLAVDVLCGGDGLMSPEQQHAGREQRKQRALLKQQEAEARRAAASAAREREIEDCGNSPLAHVYVVSATQIGMPTSWCAGCHQYEPDCESEWR